MSNSKFNNHARSRHVESHNTSVYGVSRLVRVGFSYLNGFSVAFRYQVHDSHLLVRLAESNIAWRPGVTLGFGVEIGLELVIRWKRGFGNVSFELIIRGIRFDVTVSECLD